MYAIVEIAGQQFKVEEGRKIYVHRLEEKEGERIEFDKVLLVEDDGKIIIGEPFIRDFVVEGKVLNDQVRGDKVIVFKKKRRKGYRVKNGHRQDFTQIEILYIGGKKAGSGKEAEAEKAVTVEAAAAEAGAEAIPAARTDASAKPAAAKKSSAKKAGKTDAPLKAETEKESVKKTGKTAPAKEKDSAETGSDETETA
jgi:large subunit ribosomal protein L21